MLPENIVQLALKSRKEGLTAGERGFLNQWLLENVELQEEFRQLVECGSVVQADRVFKAIQMKDAWQNVEQKLSSRPGWKKRHLAIRWSVGSCGCNYADYWRNPVDAVTCRDRAGEVSANNPGGV